MRGLSNAASAYFQQVKKLILESIFIGYTSAQIPNNHVHCNFSLSIGISMMSLHYYFSWDPYFTFTDFRITFIDDLWDFRNWSCCCWFWCQPIRIVMFMVIEINDFWSGRHPRSLNTGICKKFSQNLWKMLKLPSTGLLCRILKAARSFDRLSIEKGNMWLFWILVCAAQPFEVINV